MKTIYYFDDQNEYAGSGRAQRDPLESEKTGHDIYLLPPSATFVAPPAKREGYAIVWGGTAWKQVVDNRGVEYWLPGDSYTDSARVMSELGELPVGATLTRPAKPQEVINAERIEELEQQLRATDSIVLEMTEIAFRNGGNFVMPVDSETDYAAVLLNRQSLRAELTELKKQFS